MILRLIIVSAVLFLEACTTMGARFVATPYSGSNQENAATVIVMRERQFASFAHPVPLKVDKTLVAYLGVGDYVEFLVPSGEHFVIAGEGGFSDMARIGAKPGELYFYRYSFNPSSGKSQVTLVRLSNEEGRRELVEKNYKRLDKPQ